MMPIHLPVPMRRLPATIPAPFVRAFVAQLLAFRAAWTSDKYLSGEGCVNVRSTQLIGWEKFICTCPEIPLIPCLLPWQASGALRGAASVSDNRNLAAVGV